MKTVIQEIAATLAALRNCQARGSAEWAQRHAAHLKDLAGGYLPRGSGFDNGSTIAIDQCTEHKIVFETAFHHDNPETGFYTHWTSHRIVVTPAFDGVNITVTGRNANAIKGYIAETFMYALTQEIAC